MFFNDIIKRCKLQILEQYKEEKTSSVQYYCPIYTKINNNLKNI